MSEALGSPRHQQQVRVEQPQAERAILLFWRDVELFNLPTAPALSRDGSDLRIRELPNKPDEPLPWNDPEYRSDERSAWRHTVYLGVASKVEMFEAVVTAAVPGSSVQAFETDRITGNAWLAAFTLDELGAPIPYTYVRASFGVAARRLQSGASLDGIAADLADLRKGFEARHSDADSKASTLDLDDLQDEMELVRKPFDRIEFRVLVKSVLRLRPRQNESPAEQPDIEFLNSFFLKDIDEVISRLDAKQPIGAALRAYLGPEVPTGDRSDVLSAPNGMAPLLHPERLPTGRWPASSKHPLSLAQQAAVFESLGQLSGGSGLVAVNGPPGTGKSTLLFDIVAEIVVNRARRIAALNTPFDLFHAPQTVAGFKVFPLQESVVGNDGIVVTSSNNTAVENITRELPGRAKIAWSEYGAPKYFEAVAQSLFSAAKINEPAWGLVAAPLGNSKNCSAFADGMAPRSARRRDTALLPSMVDILEAADKDRAGSKRDWDTAKNEFVNRIKEVENERQRLVEVRRALDEMTRLANLVEQRRGEISMLESQLAQLDAAHVAEAREDQASLVLATKATEEAAIEKQTSSLAYSSAKDRMANASEQGKPPFWERWSRVIGVNTTRHQLWRERCALARTEQAEAADAFGAALKKWKDATNDFEERQRHVTTQAAARRVQRDASVGEQMHAYSALSQSEIDYREAARVVNEAKANGHTVPDPDFWQRPVGERHLASVWVTPKLDHLRANAFLAALRLHEASILACAGRFIANLRAVCAMLLRDTREPCDPKHRPLLWNMLFFCVPVVSTTLASFDRLFEGLPKESLGWILFDEAGQATPQSAVGALWRARRAVIVGDPLQIEPVMTAPTSLVRRLAERQPGLDDMWSPATQSVQTIADRTMRYGAWVRLNSEERVWTGLPLRAHRRCASPMFDIANRIAYAGQMVQASSPVEGFDCVLGPSAWYDVRGEQVNGQTVTAELNLLSSLFEKMKQNWPSFTNGKSSRAYVISPFRSVASECERRTKALGIPRTHVDCGTVHAFQGKEAEMVFVVLGSAPGPSGTGSRRWASAKPNLLNVALTRAKLRIYVIGDRAAWSECAGFDEMAAALEIRVGV